MDYSTFYGHVTAGRTECPRCGFLILWGKRQPHGKAYNPITSHLRCPECKKVYVVGQILYDVGRASRQAAPPDTIPSIRQLAELRRYARGFWAILARGKVDRVNLYLEGECCCYPAPWHPDCPVHGGELRHRRQPTPDDEE